MSYFRQEGKDQIIFATKEDHKQPSKVHIPKPDNRLEEILPDGSINWNCPLLEGRATGPCAVEFREVFECFYFEKADPTEIDCLGKFQNLQACSARYPMVYGKHLGEEDKDELLSADGRIESQLKSGKA